MEDAMEALPDPLQQAIDKALQEAPPPEGDDAAARSVSDPSSQITSMDRDISDVQECLTAIGELNLVTALQVGMQALEQFSLKAKVSRDMFGSISEYAKEMSAYAKTCVEKSVQMVSTWYCSYCGCHVCVRVSL